MNNQRKYIIGAIFLGIGIIYIIRLLYIQVLDPSYQLTAEKLSLRPIVQYPFRGLIYDRNDSMLVFNQPIFDLKVIPREVKLKDTLAFCHSFGITLEEFDERLNAAKEYSRFKPSVFLKQLSNIEVAQVQDKLINFDGFYLEARTIRNYEHSSAANLLGYIAEISPYELEQDTIDYYKTGDYIGKSGIEASYEKLLRGKRGVKYKIVDSKGVEKGDFQGGKFDTLAISGKNIQLTIDIDLQKYAESLMSGKSGSVVAIEPKTGEILTMVSSPTYDPKLLTGKKYSKNYLALQKDSLHPLFNRPIMADVYPPGSIFKLLQGLIALQEEVIIPETRFTCNRNLIACHGPHSYEDLRGAIKVSCNPYFYNTFRRIVNQNKSDNRFKDTELGLKIWGNYLYSFGLGTKLKLDIFGVKSGIVPSVKFYDRIYGKGRWKFSTIYSLSIGQGELGISPIQMANFGSIIANKGYFITPHFIKKIDSTKHSIALYKEKQYCLVDSSHFGTVINAMEDVVNYGTGFRAKVDSIAVCGKTGTSQNPHGEDHSVFIAFAPKENPKIVVSVYVENAGQGARAAASIAGLVIEKYLTGKIKRKHIEDYALKGKFIY